MITRVYIPEARKLLGNICVRSLKRWCEKNDIKIFQDTGSNKRYIVKEEMELAMNLLPEQYLKEKYKTTEWVDIIESRIKFISQYKQAIEQRNRKYTPTLTEIAKSESLRKKLAEIK